MKQLRRPWTALFILGLLALPPLLPAQGTVADYERAEKLRDKLQGLAVNIAERASWVGEMDTNVDPSSTFQVVNALIRANKTFDLLVVPGGGHGSGGDFYLRLQRDFFVRHLLGLTPPKWNALEKK
ncbi:MAG: hypothetical protein FJY80_08125 [Candidatus Aminicenantes bacterium]|nr:hypothetical protein [Candidatus Aminicenantes bacterium]